MLRLALAQVNPVMGDFRANSEKILKYANLAKQLASDIVIFPELALVGYPPDDLLFRKAFLDDCAEALDELVRAFPQDILGIIGFIRADELGIYNSAGLIYNYKLITYDKMFLPNYGVFDEFRYFTPGSSSLLISYRGAKIGLAICEDLWYPEGPIRYLAGVRGAQLIVVLNASPFELYKPRLRSDMIRIRAIDSRTYIAYVNMVGGQDELVFDGHSLVCSPTGEVTAQARGFQEELLITDIDMEQAKHLKRYFPHPIEKEKITHLYRGFQVKEIVLDSDEEFDERERSELHRELLEKLSSETGISVSYNSRIELEEPIAQVYKALTLGVRDYFHKTGFSKAVLGLSGGVDSSLVACIAVDALGAQNVIGVIMPSRYTSDESIEDATQLADNLGMRSFIISIEPIYRVFIDTLYSEVFKGFQWDTTEENLQARIRGVILMAIANKFRALTLSCSNKSEASVGYATLYGDTAGAIAPIKDVYKTMVYQLAKYRNSISKVIPDRVLVKPPSAELRPDQRDEDELMPYRILDEILKLYVEEGMDCEQIVNMGYQRDEVVKVLKLIKRNEYKRRQSPPGIKISPRAYGKDWRYPIVNCWH